MARQPGTVDAILRAFTILEALAEAPAGFSVTELARQEDVNKALTHRALASLQHAGYVAHDGGSQRYRLTPRLLAIAMGYYDSLGLRDLAGPVMQRLADDTSCNSEFTRFMDGELRILMWVPPHQRVAGLQVVSRPGDVQAPHATAAGKVWLASLQQAALDAFLKDRELVPLAPGTIVDEGGLRLELDRVRQAGYALNLEEDGVGVFALAVPIRADAAAPYLGSLGLTRPYSFEAKAAIPDLVAAASRAAGELAAVLPRDDELSAATLRSF
jgi:IclR family acetate operon transcriptional repressor